MMSTTPPTAGKHELIPDHTRPEASPPGRTPFVQLFDSLVTSGPLARLSGNALKVLAALGLASSPLGTGTKRNDYFFHDLVAAGAFSPSDRGRLFCCVAHRDLVRRTGVSKNTLSRCTAELQRLGLIEKRRVRKPDGTRYNVFFILPTSHLDKYHTHYPAPPRQASNPLPTSGKGPQALPVPTPGTNVRSKDNTTTIAGAPLARASFDREAALAHFAHRQGKAHYRPTAHDEHKLALLLQRGYSRAEVHAAIDQAFDTRPPGAPPIRMFAYCATIALATPPRCLPTSGSGEGSPAVGRGDPVSPHATIPGTPGTPPLLSCGDPISPSAATPAAPGTPPVLDQVAALHQSAIGPVTPFVRDELRSLLGDHPDPSEWNAAFHQAARANVLRLSYVVKALEGRANRRSSPSAPPGGSHAPNRPSNPPPVPDPLPAGDRNAPRRLGAPITPPSFRPSMPPRSAPAPVSPSTFASSSASSMPERLRSRLGDRYLSQGVFNPAPDYRLGTGEVTP